MFIYVLFKMEFLLENYIRFDVEIDYYVIFILFSEGKDLFNR